MNPYREQEKCKHEDAVLFVGCDLEGCYTSVCLTCRESLEQNLVCIKQHSQALPVALLFGLGIVYVVLWFSYLCYR